MKVKLPEILPAPQRHFNIPEDSLWLAGEGAGSWFAFWQSLVLNEVKVIRYSPDGELECEGIYCPDQPPNLMQPYAIGYPSHCSKITLVQNGQRITLTRKEINHEN